MMLPVIGGEGDRTLDSCVKSALLYQLSYTPTNENNTPSGIRTRDLLDENQMS